MTTQVTAAPAASARMRRSVLLTAPAAAGITFVAAWIAGLAVWPTNPSVTASGIGYLLLDNALAMAAAASLPLLLIWVCTAGLALGRYSSRSPQRRSNDSPSAQSPPSRLGSDV